MTGLETYCYDCNNPASLYLCPVCTSKLQADLDQITADFLAALHTIALRQASRGDTTGRGRGTGPTEPVSLTLLNLHDTLLHCCKNANIYAANPYDAAQAQSLQRKIGQAVEVVHGIQSEESSANIAKYKIGTIKPMRTPELCDWFKEHLGIRLRPNRIHLWVHRGKLPIKHAYHPSEIYPLLKKREKERIHHLTPKN